MANRTKRIGIRNRENASHAPHQAQPFPGNESDIHESVRLEILAEAREHAEESASTRRAAIPAPSSASQQFGFDLDAPIETAFRTIANELTWTAMTSGREVDAALAQIAIALAEAHRRIEHVESVDVSELSKAARILGSLSEGARVPPLPAEHTERARLLVASAEAAIAEIKSADPGSLDSGTAFRPWARSLCLLAIRLGLLGSHDERTAKRKSKRVGANIANGYVAGESRRPSIATMVGELAQRLSDAHDRGSLAADVVAKWVLMSLGVSEAKAKGWTYRAMTP